MLLSKPIDVTHAHAGPTPDRRAPMTRAWPWLVAAAACVIAALALWRTPSPAPACGADTLRFAVAGPASDATSPVTTDINLAPRLSPDGRMLAIPMKSEEGEALFVRPLDAFDVISIDGGGYLPFFSPGGRRMAFFRDSSFARSVFPQDVLVRQCGDDLRLALEAGQRVRIGCDGLREEKTSEGTMNEKYLVVLKRSGKEWKIVYDIYNSDTSAK